MVKDWRSPIAWVLPGTSVTVGLAGGLPAAAAVRLKVICRCGIAKLVVNHLGSHILYGLQVRPAPVLPWKRLPVVLGNVAFMVFGPDPVKVQLSPLHETFVPLVTMLGVFTEKVK